MTGTGTGTTDSSGGTIQDMTDDGIVLNDVTNITFKNMNVTGSGVQGIDADNVNGLSLDNMNIINNGNAVREHGLAADELTGTVSISDSRVGASADMNVRIINATGPLNLTVDNSTFDDTNLSGAGADGFLIETQSSAIAAVNVSGSTFGDNSTQGIQGSAIDNSDLTVNVTSSIFANNNEGIVLSTSSDADLTCDIDNNAGFTGHDGVSIFVGTASAATSASDVACHITDNSNISASSTAVNHTVFVNPSGDSTATFLVDGNTINNAGPFRALNVTNTDNFGDFTNLDVTVTNNTVNNTKASGGDHALLVEGRKDATVCARIVGNTVTNADATRSDIRLRERDNTVVTLDQGTSLLAASPLTVLNENNTATPNTVTGAPATVANGTCQTPVVLAPTTESNRIFTRNTVTGDGEGLFGQDATAQSALASFISLSETGGPANGVQLDTVSGYREFAANTLQSTAVPVARVTPTSPIKSETEGPAFAALRTVGHGFGVLASPLPSGETINLNIGTLNAGQSVTITFDVTIDDPFPAGSTQICNQSTISGSNFTDVLTDDPDVGGVSDPTCTNVEASTVETIKIVKSTSPAGGMGFGFTDDIAGPNNFSLNHGETKTFGNVAADAYMVTEDDPAVTPGGFNLTALSCDDGASTTPSTTNLGTRTANINLDAGEPVTCTFTNTIIVEEPPASVGGVTSYPKDSGSYAVRNGLLVGGAAIVAVGAGAWYNRRRWLGIRNGPLS